MVSEHELKERARAVWGAGDYRPMARVLEPASRELVEACAISAGQHVLDVAAGDGNCAAVAARKGARVVACDFSPRLLELGQARTRSEGLDVRWDLADVEDLPYEDETFDCVTSVFGAIFAPDQHRAAREMFRVVRSGGIVGMANWTPRSFAGEFLQVLARYGPPPPDEGTPRPIGWGEEQKVESLFAGLVASIDFALHAVRFGFDSAAELMQVFEAHGMAVIARKTLAPQRYEAMMADVEQLIARRNEATDGGVLFDNEYLRVVARKA